MLVGRIFRLIRCELIGHVWSPLTPEGRVCEECGKRLAR